MKRPKKVKKEHIKCVSCGEPIHIDDLGGIIKKGMFHNNVVCLLPISKELK